MADDPALPPGKQQYDQYVQQYGPEQADSWKAQSIGASLKAGRSAEQIDKYFGDAEPEHQGTDTLVQTNLLRFGPNTDPKTGIQKADPNSSPWDDYIHGFNSSALGETLQKWAVVGRANETGVFTRPAETQGGEGFLHDLGFQAGQMVGNLPYNIAGLAGGIVTGGPVGAFAGFGAAPTAARETIINSYGLPGGPKTAADWSKVVGTSAWKTAQSATTGLLGPVAGKLAELTPGPAVAKAFTTGATWLAGQTGLNFAMTGQVPDRDNLIASSVLMLAPGVVLHYAGQRSGGQATPEEQPNETPGQTVEREGGMADWRASGMRARKRANASPTPGTDVSTVTEAQRTLEHNLGDVYAKTGTHPNDVATRANTDTSYDQEIRGVDHNGDPITPQAREEARPSPPPFKPRPLTSVDEHRLQSQDINDQNVAAPPLARADILIPALEGGVDKYGRARISPTGAVGKWQIEPSSARHWGLRGSNAEITQQLEDPAVNEEIGQRGQAEGRKLYPNDTLAQLVFWNAGPKRANEFITQGPGTRLEAIPDRTVRGGIRYESVPAARNESKLPLETQHYLANGRRLAKGGSMPEPTGQPQEFPDPNLAPQEEAEASEEAQAEEAARQEALGIGKGMDTPLTEEWNNATPEMQDRIRSAVADEVGKPSETDAEAVKAAQQDARVATERYLMYPDLLPPEGPSPSITVGHVSVHHFDEFDLSKSRTGEGHQTFGAGAYFSTSQQVLEHYVEQFKRALQNGSDIPRGIAAGLLHDTGLTPEQAIAELEHRTKQSKNIPEGFSSKPFEEFAEQNNRSIQHIKEGTATPVQYQAKIPNSNRYLDFDKTFAEQPLAVQDAIAAAIGVEPESLHGHSGSQIYKELSKKLKGDEKASAKLNSLGITGIRYGAARGRGGTNYVIFNDKDINLTHRNGEPIKPSEAAATREEANLEAKPAESGGSGNEPPKGTSAGAASPWENATEGEKFDAMRAQVGKPGKPSLIVDPAKSVNEALTDWVSILWPGHLLDNDRIAASDLDRMRQMGNEDWFRRVYGANDVYSAFEEDGRVDPYTGEIDRTNSTTKKMIVDKLKETGGNVENMFDTMLAMRTVNRAAQGIDTGFDLEWAKAIVNDPKIMARYQEAIDLYQHFRDGVLNYALEAGLISQDQFNGMKVNDPVWVSMRRLQGDDASFDAKLANGDLTRMAKVIHAMEGSDGKIIDPALSGDDNARVMIRNSLINIARAKMVDTFQRNPELAAKYGFNVRKGEVATDDEIDSALRKYGFTDAELPEAREAFGGIISQRLDSALGPTEFSYYENGQRMVASIDDPLLAKLMKSAMGERDAIDILQSMAAIQRAGIVLEPAFQAAFGTMHELTAFIFDPNHPVPFLTMARGILHVMGKSDLYRELRAAGGLGKSITDLDNTWNKGDLYNQLSKENVWNRVINTVSDPQQFVLTLLRALQAPSHFMTAARNVGMYATVKGRQGMEPGRAAMMARKESVDYSERGARILAQKVASWSAFFHARLLVTKQMMEGFEPQSAKYGLGTAVAGTMGATFAAVVMPMLIARVLNHEADKHRPLGQRYIDQPRVYRDTHLMVPVGDTFLSIKLPEMWSTVIGGAVNRTFDATIEHDPNAFHGWLQNIAQNTIPNPIPTAVQAGGELLWAQMTPFGNPMIPGSLKQLTPDLQWTKDTTTTAKAVSSALGLGTKAITGTPHTLSPILLDQATGLFLGPAGTDTLKVLGAPADIANNKFDWTSAPFIHSFFTRNPGMNSQVIQDYYDQSHSFLAQYNDIKFLAKRAEFGGTVNFQNVRLSEAAAVGILAHTNMALSTARHIVDGINNNPHMTPDEKRQKIDTVSAFAVGMAQSANALMEATKKAERGRPTTIGDFQQQALHPNGGQ